MIVVKQSANAVRVDPRRVEQIKAIAAKEGKTSAGVIAAMIREKIAAGVIPASIPGILVNKEPDGISLSIDHSAPAKLPMAGAAKLADAMRAVVNGAPGEINLDYGFAFVRQGVGYKLIAPFPSNEHGLTGDLASDLADLIEAALR